MDMKFLQSLIIIGLITLVSSCAPLTKSQVRVSHNYFEAVANYPRYYRELNTTVADINLEAQNLESSLQTSDSIRVATIIESINEYQRSMRIPDSILVHVRYLERYVQDYYSLIPNGFNIYGALKGTTETIGGIFGLGGVVRGILPNNVNGLNPTKKRKIRMHVLSSEATLLESLTILKGYINNSYLPQLEKIDDKSIVDFEDLLSSINDTTPPLEYYTKHNRMLTTFYQRLYATMSLVRQLSRAIESYEKVEKQLTKSFQERGRLEMESTNVNALLSEMQRINFLIVELNERRSSFQ